jgi:hypothetical protein
MIYSLVGIHNQFSYVGKPLIFSDTGLTQNLCKDK